MVPSIRAHQSPLELKIVNRDCDTLIKIVISIKALRSLLELLVKKRDSADPDGDYGWSPFEVHWSWRLRRETMMSFFSWWLPLESDGVGLWEERLCWAEMILNLRSFLDEHASLYLLVPARLPVCPFQLALGKDDIKAHPLRPMSYWFNISLINSNNTNKLIVFVFVSVNHFFLKKKIKIPSFLFTCSLFDDQYNRKWSYL
jgi:hypothetical protein